jgi:phosphoglycerate dehydrogenase-like enzyme
MLRSNERLINVVRGPVVGEVVMNDVLKCGSIASAYWDVFYHEPLLRESAL